MGPSVHHFLLERVAGGKQKQRQAWLLLALMSQAGQERGRLTKLFCGHGITMLVVDRKECEEESRERGRVVGKERKASPTLAPAALGLLSRRSRPQDAAAGTAHQHTQHAMVTMTLRGSAFGSRGGREHTRKRRYIKTDR